MDDVISKIKERIDIVDLISSYLKLQKSGVNYKARCPFHNEKTGSFFVSPERQIWHCFGCNSGGDAFGFVKQIEGVEFPEALRILAARAGVELERFQSPEYKQFQSEKTKLFEINELAARFFEKQLHESSSGKQVLAYLKERGLADESIKNFRLGWAPPPVGGSWNALSDFITRKYSTQELVSSGLAIKKDTGGVYDRFRSRIMFPIFDISGQVVGFSGRIFGTTTSEETAKYVNTPQTSIYDKSRILYGLDKAKLGIRQNNKCIAVEGNMDVIMSHQAGVTNAVATSGTALTDGHLKIIKRYTDNLDLCFDSDSAGEMATARGVDLALARDFNVGIIAISEPGLKDPADFVKKNGTAWGEYVVGRSKPFVQFFFENARNKFDIATATGKKMFTKKLLPLIASIASKIEQAHWVNEISAALHLKEEVIRQELTSYRSIAGQNMPASEIPIGLKKNPPAQRLNMVEEGLLSLVLKKPELAAALKQENEVFLSEQCRNLIKEIGNNAQINEASSGVKMSLDIAFLKAQELWKDFEDIQIEREFQTLLLQAKKRFVSSQLERLEYEIKDAERSQDKDLLARLMADFSKISKELGN